MRNELVNAEALPIERQERLARILDDYLIAAERGNPVSPTELLAQHPADSEYLRPYLSGLNLFHNAAGGFHKSLTSSGDSVVYQKPGQTIGDFRLIREIGRGGMGVVYEAEQLSLKRRVALKVLPFVAASNEKNLQRFKTESQIAASIEHPNIVPVYAIGEEHGIHFYAMQLIHGHSLTELLGDLHGGTETVAFNATESVTRSESWPSSDVSDSSYREDRSHTSLKVSIDGSNLRNHIHEVSRLGIQAADALHAAHEYGVVHRDIKPSNLMIDESGKLLITDFGLARCREGSGLTQTGELLGTVRYMSPEQARGLSAIIDHRTDVYSLGITLYEIASLKHPLYADGNAILQQDRSRFQPLRHWDRRIPEDFETIVMKSLAELPADRYSTAAELADDLRRFLADEPILAKRPSLISRGRKWARRHRRAVLSAVSALGIAVVALSVALMLVSQEKAKTEVFLVRSQTNLQQTRDVLDRFGSRLAEQLAAIPGAEHVRLQLLEESLSYYHQLANQASNDPTLAADVALAYSKLGELSAKTGDKEDALAYHRQAKRSLESLLAQDNENYKRARSLAVCWSNIGFSLLELGLEEEALRSCGKSLEIQQRLFERFPDSLELKTDAVATYTNLGLVYRSRNAFVDAAESFSKAISLQQQVADSSPSEESLRQLSLGYSNLASVHEANGDRRAKQFYSQAIALQKSLVANQPLNLVYQSDLARTYNNLGYFSALGKDWEEAELCYDDAMKIQKYLVKSAPAVAAYRRDLAVSQSNLGMSLTQQKQYDDAKELFHAAGQIQQQLLARSPSDTQALTSLGSIYNNAGILLERQSKLVAASKAFRQAVEQQAKALEVAPASQRIRKLLSNHLVNQASCSHRLGNLEQALSISLQRRELWVGNPEQVLGVAQEMLGYRPVSTLRSRSTSIVRDRFLDTAVETLQLATECGLEKERLLDNCFIALRHQPQFQAMIEEGMKESNEMPATYSRLESELN